MGPACAGARGQLSLETSLERCYGSATAEPSNEEGFMSHTHPPLRRLAIACALALSPAVYAQSPSACSGTSCQYLNPALSPEVRAADLVARMTLEEKAAQLGNTAPAIARLGVPRY